MCEVNERATAKVDSSNYISVFAWKAEPWTVLSGADCAAAGKGGGRGGIAAGGGAGAGEAGPMPAGLLLRESSIAAAAATTITPIAIS